MLPVEAFGTYSFAGAIVGISVVLVSFGIDWAFVHRAPETEDEGLAAASHFTLILILMLIWALFHIVGAFVFASGQRRVALLVVTFGAAGAQLTKTPQMILIRRVVHRRLALLRLVNTILPSVVAVGLAWQGVSLWALLSTDLMALVSNVIVLYLWRPVWKPRLLWSTVQIKYFLRFGARNTLTALLLKAVNEVDDLWIGFALGERALGFYARAYSFALYPSQILATPVNAVATGSYAELKGDRERLSKAFYRINALLVRSGFLLSGMLLLVAPEYIRLILDPKWLPMLNTFRLMLVFTLLDPIKATVGNLFIAVGQPEALVRARLVQLAVLLFGLIVLGKRWGLAGCALAVDIMALVAMAILFAQARRHVDFSLWRLFGVPCLALAAGTAVALGAGTWFGSSAHDWQTASLKACTLCVVYGGILLVLERDQVSELSLMIKSAMVPGK
jgi:O-antigen/teichoic acid export membrane protein